MAQDAAVGAPKLVGVRHASWEEGLAEIHFGGGQGISMVLGDAREVTLVWEGKCGDRPASRALDGPSEFARYARVGRDLARFTAGSTGHAHGEQKR